MKAPHGADLSDDRESAVDRPQRPAAIPATHADDEQALLAEFLAAGSLDDLIPSIARDRQAIQRIETVVRGLATGTSG